MLNKIYYMFSLKGIFDFSYSRFDNVRVKSNGNDIKDKKKFRAVIPIKLQHF